MLMNLTLPYPVGTGNHAVKHTRAGAHYLTDQAKAYRVEVLQACLRAGVAGRKLAGPLQVDYLVCPPDGRARDDDNLLKVVKDALTKAGFWVDDSNKVIRKSTIEWTEPFGGGEIWLSVREHRGGARLASAAFSAARQGPGLTQPEKIAPRAANPFGVSQ